MSRILSLALCLVILFVASSLAAQDLALPPKQPRLASEGMPGLSTIALEAAIPQEKLELLRIAGIEPENNIAYEVTGPEEVTVAAFREPLGARLFLYHLAENESDVFVRVGTDGDGQPEVRIWSAGPSEIIINATGMQLIDQQSAETFRFRVGANAFSVTDTIACIGRALGISLTRTALENGLARAACSATSSITLILTVTNCFSIPSAGPALVFGTIGCVNGFAKVLSCGIAYCTTCELPSISLGRSLSGSWGAPCRSQRSTRSYAKFYTFTITRRTTVDIVATSNNADPVLYLLKGGAITSPVLSSNDNGGGGVNARINRTLDAGTYTIEVLNKGIDRGGNFTLTLR